ncbi:helix-turn-helix domain-containing protein [Bacillus paranthracis]|nr:helix-turn-helix domain-containing protein [Bacillus paranthracis]MBE7156681.1 helix-turn-helix domain-containing protein [Bacillus paranthracis]
MILSVCDSAKELNERKFKGRSKKYHKNHAGMNYAVKLYKEGDMTVNKKLMKLQMCLGLII